MSLLKGGFQLKIHPNINRVDYRNLVTSESVTEGHPDKLCDKIADSILDVILQEDPNARVACEVAVTTGLVMVMGEISTVCQHVLANIPEIVRETVRNIGYSGERYGFNGETCGVIVSIGGQSDDIAQGVNKSLEARQLEESGQIDELGFSLLGAGDQGLMYGFASNETPEFMPMAIMIAHRLTERLTEVRKDEVLDYLRPDGKSMVTIEYEDNIPKRLEGIVIAAQHDPNVEYETLYKDIIDYVIRPVVPNHLIDKETGIFVNPTGRFVIGGPHGDSGVTGRKIIVDTYGGAARHGGGSFSGKDPTKVDRTAAYALRWVAKNLVAAGVAEKCEVQASYIIGRAYPIAVGIETYGTGKIDDKKILEIINKHFDLSPAAIIDRFQLRRPIYSPLAAYGHFGRIDLPKENVLWEELDKVDAIKRDIS